MNNRSIRILQLAAGAMVIASAFATESIAQGSDDQVPVSYSRGVQSAKFVAPSAARPESSDRRVAWTARPAEKPGSNAPWYPAFILLGVGF